MFFSLCVILHHLSQNRAFSSGGVIGAFEDIGFLFVAVFFFCSGFGLVRSLDTKGGYLDGFVRKRIMPVLVAFLLMNLIYAAFRLLSGDDMPAAQLVTGILGLVLLNDQAWYVVVILMMYTIFYVCFRFVKSRRVSFAVVLASILVQGALFCVLGHFAWWSAPDNWRELLRGGGDWWQKFGVLWFQGEWWVNSTIAFFAGMLVASGYDRAVAFLRKRYLLKAFVLLCATAAAFFLARSVTEGVSYWSEFSGRLGIGNKFACYFAQMPLVVCVSLCVFVLSAGIRLGNVALRFLGGLSLELYLMQAIPLDLLDALVLTKERLSGSGRIWFLVLYAALVIASALLLAVAFRWFHGRLCGLLLRERPPR